jgi:3-oxoacyl-[acyl-carrier protein] reductase
MTQNNETFAPSAWQTGRRRDRLDELYQGYCDSISRTITADDVATFARLSGDYNALHVDDEFAARTEFEQRVVHGFLHASLLSTLVGMKIPGHGALYLSQSFDFTHPVFIGDTVEARGVIEKIETGTRILTIATEITNQHGDRVLKGTATVKVLRLTTEDAAMADSLKPQFSDTLLKNRTALVTGASRGIGRAIAAILCDHGAHVYVNYRTSEQAALSLVSELTKRGGSASMVKADVTQADDAARLVLEVGNERGLDILINNAGPKIKSGPFETLGWADMHLAHEQIVGSVFHITKAALPALKASTGRIVNVLSSAALGRTAHNWLPYVSAKAALLGMSKNLAQELGPKGVRVNMVSPSMTETDLTAEVPDRIRQMMVSRTPLRRLATPEDVAGTVLFLVSPYADFITGENLLVTGGDVML